MAEPIAPESIDGNFCGFPSHEAATSRRGTHTATKRCREVPQVLRVTRKIASMDDPTLDPACGRGIWWKLDTMTALGLYGHLE